MADMARRTTQLNQLTETIRVHAVRVQDAEAVINRGSLDAIICNPPYALPGTSLRNPSDTLSAARHQPQEGIGDWFRMAHLLLKGKGRIFLVYPAPRMLSLMEQL